MKKKNIIKAFTSLDPQSLELVDKLATSEENAIKGYNNVHELESFILEGMTRIKNKAEELTIKVNTALFGNKKFINESYAFEIPLKEEYFNTPERVSFKDNILTTRVIQDGTKSKMELSPLNLTSRRNTDFRFVGNTLYLKKNEEHSYQELEIRIPKDTSGYLYLEFNRYDNISILDRYGRELVDKTITNKIHHVVTRDTGSVILRFHTNMDKSFLINHFYITKENFSRMSEVETKPIRIGYNLSQIGINTCDNYSESNIDYHISINGGEYQRIRPLNKQKNLNLESILSVDRKEHYYHLREYAFHNDKMLFSTNTLEAPDVTITRAFNFKLGVDEGLVRGRTMYVALRESYDLIVHKDDTLKVNGVTIVAPKDNYTITLNKGFNTIEGDIRDVENFLGKSEISISDNILSYTQGGKKYNKLIDFNPNLKEKNSLIYQLITKGDIFLEPIEAKKYHVNNVLFIEKENLLKQLHLFVKNNVLKVDTIQLKIKLEAENNPAYISSLTVRGTK